MHRNRHRGSRIAPFLPIVAALCLLGNIPCSPSPCRAEVVPPYVSGDDVNVPNAVPGKLRLWTPANTATEAGFARGLAFEAALLKVISEDTQFSKEVAIFKLKSGVVRAFQSRSFVPGDIAVITAFKAAQPMPPPETRVYHVKDLENAMALLAKHKVFEYETTHFAFWYGPDRNREGKELSDPEFLRKAGEWYEKVWDHNRFQMGAPMPYADDEHPCKINVSLTHTGLPWLTGDDWAESAENMVLMPTVMFYGSTAVPHEFTHVIQFYSGGFRDSDSVGAFWETHAEFGAVAFSPTFDEDMGDMMKGLRMGFQWPQTRYANFPILFQLWEKRRTAPLTYGIWPHNLRKPDGGTLEDPAETMVRLGEKNGALPQGWISFGDEVGQMAARFVGMDYINQRYFWDATEPVRAASLFPLEPAQKKDWLGPPPDKKLHAYGAMHFRVKPKPGAATIRVTLMGLTDVNRATWRLTLVGVNEHLECRYSPMARISAEEPGSVELEVRPEETYTIAVAAAPLHYVPVFWKEPVKEPETSYPFCLRLAGAGQ